jgi:hypothetical protein
MFMTKDELLQLCAETNGGTGLLATGTDTDKKIRINFGTRPEVVKYYSDYGNTAHEVAAGSMTWLLVGSEDENRAVLYSEEPIVSANKLKYPNNNNYEPTAGSRLALATKNIFRISEHFGNRCCTESLGSKQSERSIKCVV